VRPPIEAVKIYFSKIPREIVTRRETSTLPIIHTGED